MLPQTQQTLHHILPLLLVEVYAQEAVIDVDLDDLGELLDPNNQAFLHVGEGLAMLSMIIAQLHQCTQKVIVHQPKIREIATL